MRVLFCLVLVFASLLPLSFGSAYAQQPITSFFSKDLPKFQENIKDETPKAAFITRYEEDASGVSSVPALKDPELERAGGGEGFDEGNAPVSFEADSMSYDEVDEVALASGNVVLEQNGRVLTADEVRYNAPIDRVEARGNVVLREVNGDQYFADFAALEDNFSNGNIEELKTVLVDGSRFEAKDGVREDGKRIIMSGASYTPCEQCELDPDKAPAWRIRASEVKHDEEDARIYYKNARFEVYGVPVAYTPYFAHPDGSIDRKSGFLAPSLGYKSEFGAFVENNYYWSIAPDKDATFGVVAMTEEAPLGLLEYRQRWDNASFIINGGITNSERTDEDADVDFEQDSELRGHVFAEGLWNINNKWRSGFNVEYVSDDQYARQYDITSNDDDLTSEDVLENKLYVERFSGRDYATASLQTYQDTRISDLEADQPEVLPQASASFVGDAGAVPVIKGRWDASASFLNLRRDGDGQDLTRASLDAGWKRRFVSNTGLVADADISLRGDVYQVNDRDIADDENARSSDSRQARFYPQAHFEASYPVSKNYSNGQIRLEPIAAFTAAPSIDEDDDIPNEDSQDVQLDASNLFNANRFSGFDEVEDNTRVTYGMRGGYHHFDGSYVEGFLGQSYRFDEEGNPFSDGSGLEDQNSDIVGYVDTRIGDVYDFAYRFQLDNDTLSSARHELSANASWNRLQLGGSYLYAQALDGTEIDENREQLAANAAYYLNKEWRLRSSAQYDLGVDPGLRTMRFGVDHFGQCVFWSVTGERNFTDDASGDSDTEVIFRIGLRNISDFVVSGLRDNP